MINDRTESLKAALKENGGHKACDAITKDVKDQKKLTSKFFKEVEEISQYLEKIESDVEEVGKKFDAVLAVPEPDEEIKLDIESATVEIKRLAMKVRKKLKCMEYACETERDENGTSAEFRLRATQHSTLSKRLADAMLEFNQVQTAHREKSKSRIKRELEIVGKISTDEEIEEMIEKRNPAIFTQDLLVETLDAKRTLADIEDRYADIMKLEKSIKEVHELFMDISFLVETQGELIDHIEYNVHTAANFVDMGSGQVRKARRHRKSVRRRKIILAIVVIIAVVVTGMVIALT